MRTITTRRPLFFLTAALAIFAIGFAACSSNDDDPTATPVDGGDAVEEQGSPDDSLSTSAPALSDDPAGDDINLPAREPESFVGLTRDEAAALAESEGRIWRVGREDGVYLPVTEDYRVGRVTFELESDRVTAATIEQPLDDIPDDVVDPSVPLDVEDGDAAAIVAAATTRLLTVDHSFGPDVSPPFSDVRVASTAGGTGGIPLAPLTLEMIASAVQDTGATVQFVDDSRAMIDDLFDGATPGVAVLTVGSLRMDGDRAEVEMQLWCGSLCGVYLTYEAIQSDDGWTITDTVGPIALS